VRICAQQKEIQQGQTKQQMPPSHGNQVLMTFPTGTVSGWYDQAHEQTASNCADRSTLGAIRVITMARAAAMTDDRLVSIASG
jgi:hypothetical protein